MNISLSCSKTLPQLISYFNSLSKDPLTSQSQHQLDTQSDNRHIPSRHTRWSVEGLWCWQTSSTSSRHCLQTVVASQTTSAWQRSQASCLSSPSHRSLNWHCQLAQQVLALSHPWHSQTTSSYTDSAPVPPCTTSIWRLTAQFIAQDKHFATSPATVTWRILHVVWPIFWCCGWNCNDFVTAIIQYDTPVLVLIINIMT